MATFCTPPFGRAPRQRNGAKILWKTGPCHLDADQGSILRLTLGLGFITVPQGKLQQHSEANSHDLNLAVFDLGGTGRGALRLRSKRHDKHGDRHP
jgi:hypothetical protein